MPKVKLPRAECTRFDLPPVCVVTGSKQYVGWHEMKFQHMPQWAFFVGGVLLGSIFMKKMTAELPFTNQAWEDHQRAKVMGYVAAFVFFLLFFGGGMAAALLEKKENLSALFGVGGFFGAITITLILWFAFIRNRSPRCLWMNDEYIELDVPSEAAVAAMRARFGQERTKPRGLFGL
jgi:hypothetical protein